MPPPESLTRHASARWVDFEEVTHLQQCKDGPYYPTFIARIDFKKWVGEVVSRTLPPNFWTYYRSEGRLVREPPEKGPLYETHSEAPLPPPSTTPYFGYNSILETIGECLGKGG
eukprot:758827-Hanusia_phi.AAC.7